MNNKFLIFLALVAAIGLGYLLGLTRNQTLPATTTSVASEEDILYWVAPMDANFRRDEPGKSPMGMDLIPVYATEQSTDEFSVQISPTVTQNLGVRTAKAEIKPWSNPISTVGEIAWDGSRVRKIYARAEGWLETFNLNSVGQRIEEDELIYGLYAPQLVTAQEEYLQALKSGNSVQIQNSRRRLLALGLIAEQVEQLNTRRKTQRLVNQRAEESAVVLSLKLATGSHVTPQTEIASIVSTEKVWVEGYLPESDAAEISVGDLLTVSVNAYPHKTIDAKLDHVYPQLDRATRTVKVRAVLDNPLGNLKAGMLARLTIQPRGEDALQVPHEAVIRARDGNRVVVSAGEGLFTVKPVLLGAESSMSVAVLEGLMPGERVVTSGQFLIDAEANGRQALDRLNSPRTAEGTATIVGFPERGQLRLLHNPIDTLDWPGMNMVFAIAGDISLMPYSKEDRVNFKIREQQNGDWEITAIERAEDLNTQPSMPKSHEGMSHD